MFPFANRVPAVDRRNYILDGISATYYGYFQGFMLPFIPVLLKRMNAGPMEMGISLAAPFIPLLLAVPMARFLSGYKALDIVAIPTFFSRLSVLLIGLAGDTRQILAIYVLAQFIEGLGVSPYTRVLKDLYSDAGRSRAMGFVRVHLSIGYVISAALGGLLIDRGNLFLCFLLSGISGAVSSANFLRVFDRANSPAYVAKQFGPRDFMRCFEKSEGFFWMASVVSLFGFGNLLVVGVLPTVLVESYNISNEALGYLNGLTYIVQLLSYMFIGGYIARNGAQKGLLLGMCAGSLNPWLFLCAPGTGYLSVPFALNGLMYAGFDMSWMLLVISYAPEAEISAYSTAYAFLLGFRGTIAEMATNLALPALGTKVFLLLGGFCTLFGIGLGLFIRDSWRDSER